MRLQVQILNETPQTYALDKDEMILGSSKKADILIALPEISRQHLTITREGERFFITDNGSTNGTWQNEQKIAPGAKMEITTFFQYRLAQTVTISLINEDLTGATQMKNPMDLPTQMRQIGKDNTKTELILDIKKPKEKPKKVIPKVPSEPEIETGGGLVKGVILIVVLAAVGFYVYKNFLN